MGKWNKILIFVSLYLATVHSYVQFDNYDKMIDYFDENSLLPIIQIYHNRHFSNSRQYDEFLSVLQESEYINKDYCRYVLVNCEKIKEGNAGPCDQMRRTKDNRKIIIYYPSEDFKNYGGKKLLTPSKSRILTHPNDVFPASEYEKLIEEVIPSFYEELTSLEQFQDWMQPRHTPKIAFFTRQEEIPMVLKKLGVHYFLRFDLGYISDLTESIVNKMNITTFPKLMVINYNHNENTYDIFQYKDNDFSAKSYHKIKQFLEQYALKEPRNDLIFQKIKMPTEKDLTTVTNKSQVRRFLDHSLGWTIIEEVKGQPLQLKALKEKYGRYFNYIHFDNGDQTEVLALIDTDKGESYGIEGQIKFQALTAEEYLQASTLWLAKNYVVITVREQYGHICAIEKTALFKGLTHCLIVKDSDYEEASKALNIPFEFGFSCFESILADPKEKIIGKTFKSTDYKQVYESVEYLLKRKSKEVIDDFEARPVRQIEKSDTLSNICLFPNKKCALLFTHGNKKDRTAFDYLKEVAVNFINDYDFYEIDLNCNPHFQEQIPNLKTSYGGLVVYHPSKSSYVSLKARLSKSTFEKFLKANLRDNKKLPFHELSKEIKVNPCNEKIHQETNSSQNVDEGL